MSLGSTALRAGRRRISSRVLPGPLVALRSRPELGGLMALSGLLNLWGLSINGWANAYYSAAVRSMTTSWHDFLFISLDRTGLMTVDKPPLALWVQALSARVFGFYPLSLLVPQAMMGVAATGLVYDLVRRRFGRPAGFAAGLVLATTPVVVAVSRHNNPDELLVLCSVAAVWFCLRALETGATTCLVWAGVAVGLGFETKMGVALLVVPGIAASYLYVAPRGYLTSLRQLLAGGVALAVVGLAWPLLVTLTPAADRPWISGTSDNSIWSLIFAYNGVGRLTGQTGGPGAVAGVGGPGGGVGRGGLVGGGLFGGPTGAFRLLQSSLGDQVGWLLGFALVAGAGVLVAGRLGRRDPRTGWVIAVGGACLTTAVVFSYASGIFHPYYVSLLAPFSAALVGAGVGMGLSGTLTGRITAALAIVSGAATELVVLGTLSGSLSWGAPVAIVGALLGVVGLGVSRARRVRIGLVAVALAALFAAPATWATETLGHATSGTFPAGGSASAGFGGPPGSGALSGLGPGAVGGLLPPFGAGRARLGRLFGAGRGGGFGPGGPRSPGGPGAGADSARLQSAIGYARTHGGGAIGVASQSSAAEAIISQNASVAGLGGFSGRESSVTVRWIAMEVRDGRLRWIVAGGGRLGGGVPGDTRRGSQGAISVAVTACRRVTLGATSSPAVTMYDCRGRAAAIILAAGQ